MTLVTDGRILRDRRSARSWSERVAFPLLACLLWMSCLSSASALTINRTFFGGSPPVVSAGGGDIVDIFNTAADWWEASILDAHTIDINFGWEPLDTTILADALPFDLIPFTSGRVRFANNRSDWFLDPTPTDDAEYLSYSETEEDLGGGVVNTGRVHGTPVGDAFGRFDLLSVAAHEIGHLLGVFDYPFVDPLPDPLLITNPRPFAGTSIDTTESHFVFDRFPDAVMTAFGVLDARRNLSAIDILAAAERSGFSDLNLDPLAEPATVSEPAPIALVALLGLIATALTRRPRA